MRGLFRNGGNWIAGGVVAAALVPALAIGLVIPLPIAIVAAVLAFAGVGYLTAPRGLLEGVDVARIGAGRVELARKVLGEAMPELERLIGRATAIRRPGARVKVEHLAGTANAILAGVEKDPDRLMSVQRFLTYYLPQAADLAESYGVLEQQRNPDPKRFVEIETLLGRLDDAFTHYADSLLESDLAGLDTDLRLLSASLEADLGKKP